jgi:hypothetical protein
MGFGFASPMPLARGLRVAGLVSHEGLFRLELWYHQIERTLILPLDNPIIPFRMTTQVISSFRMTTRSRHGTRLRLAHAARSRFLVGGFSLTSIWTRDNFCRPSRAKDACQQRRKKADKSETQHNQPSTRAAAPQ